MDQGAVAFAAQAGEVAHAQGVDGERFVRFALGFINEVVGGAVDDHVGIGGVEQGLEAVGLGEVGVVAAGFEDVAVQPWAEVAAELAAAPRTR